MRLLMFLKKINFVFSKTKKDKFWLNSSIRHDIIHLTLCTVKGKANKQKLRMKHEKNISKTFLPFKSHMGYPNAINRQPFCERIFIFPT